MFVAAGAVNLVQPLASEPTAAAALESSLSRSIANVCGRPSSYRQPSIGKFNWRCEHERENIDAEPSV